MKVALITDTHYGVRGDSEIFHKHFEKFYSEVFFPYLQENNIKQIIHLGDAFDRRKYINFVSLKRCKEYFYDPIMRDNILLHEIVGNHDTSYKNTNSVNSPDLLLGEYRSNLKIYSHPTEIEIDGRKIAIMPWICTDNHEAALNLIQNSNASVLMGHLELDGFEMYRGSPHSGGMSAEVFSKFDMVLSGHFHHKSSKGNIHYLGCPYEMTWSDYGDQKGFHVFDTETSELQFIPNPLVLFRKIFYNDSKWKDAAAFNDLDFSVLSDLFVKIIVKNKSNPYWFDLFMSKIEKSNPADILVVDDHLNLDKIDDQDILENLDDTLTILHNSINSVQVEVDKTKLDSLIKTLYQEAVHLE